MNLRQKLILALVLLLVPLMAADIYYHYKQYTLRRSESLIQYRETALDLARNTHLLISRTVALEKTIDKTLNFADWRSSAIRHRYLESVVEPDSILSNIALIDVSGKIIDHAEEPSRHSTIIDVPDREYFKKLRSKNLRNDQNWVVSDLLVNHPDQKPGFIVAVALHHGNQFAGVITTRIDERRVRQLLEMPEVGQTILVLADRQGRTTYMSNQPDLTYEQRKPRDHYFHLEQKQPFKLLMHADLPGQGNLSGAVVRVPEIGWTAGDFASAGQNLQADRASVIRDILAICAIFIFTVIAGTFFARQLTTSMTELSTAANLLGEGHLETRVALPRVAEFATLATTMNNMAVSIQQRDEALQQAYQRERRISTAFQESMLPDVPAQIGRIELATAYFPALKEAELGGDFYDVNLLPNGLVGLLVADVSGKGLLAAVHTATAKYALQGFAYEDPDPAKTLCRLSAVLYDNFYTDKFITAFYAVVDPDTGRMVYANAGHPQPILRRKDGSMEWLKIASGPPLGISRQPDYIANELSLCENDMLVSYTDGVIEARNGTIWFGSEGLEAILKDADCAPSDIVCTIHQTVSDFVGGELLDDIALLAVRMTSASRNTLTGARADCSR